MEKKETKSNIKIDSNARYRVSVFRSNKAIYAQIVDYKSGVTIGSASSLKIGEKKTPCEKATMVGENLAKLANERKIKKITYDRGSYRYHGQVKALAEGMRKAGLEF
jgi:large subunit ribosomal protein L18